MNKQENGETRYFVRWETHATWMSKGLCSLMEHQSLVDVAVCCGTNTIHAHKCVLAANSLYFREQLEKNVGTEQIIITGIDFNIVRSIIEYMYGGVTNILHKHLKYMVAAAKFFQLRGLKVLTTDQENIRYEADVIHIPPPIFLTKKPKYPNSYTPLSASNAPDDFNTFKNPIANENYMQRKVKRKFVRSEAEKACAKEAAASRLALEALQREIASAPQASSFVIEESCAETTVENFIPHTDETYIQNLAQIDNVSQLQVVNFDDLNNTFVNNQIINLGKTMNNMVQFDIPTNSTKDRLKHILGTDIPGNVEMMFRTSDGHIVNVTDDVLQNLSGGTLQYQIVDENGQLGELRELEIHDQAALANYEELPQHYYNAETNPEPLLHVPDESVQETLANVDKLDPDYVVSSSSSLSGCKTSSSVSTSSESKIEEADKFIDALRSDQNHELYNTIFDEGNVKEATDENVSARSDDTVMFVEADVDDIIDVTSVINDGDDSYIPASRDENVSSILIDDNDLPEQLLNVPKKILRSPRMTRTNFSRAKADGVTLQGCNDAAIADSKLTSVKLEKPRRLMPVRRKK